MSIIRSPGKGRPRRGDLLYRDLANQSIGDAADASYLDDARLDAITERVIDYMDKTDISDWDSMQWGLFKAMWADRKMRRRNKDTTIQDLSAEELRDMLE